MFYEWEDKEAEDPPQDSTKQFQAQLNKEPIAKPDSGTTVSTPKEQQGAVSKGKVKEAPPSTLENGQTNKKLGTLEEIGPEKMKEPQYEADRRDGVHEMTIAHWKHGIFWTKFGFNDKKELVKVTMGIGDQTGVTRRYFNQGEVEKPQSGVKFRQDGKAAKLDAGWYSQVDSTNEWTKDGFDHPLFSKHDGTYVFEDDASHGSGEEWQVSSDWKGPTHEGTCFNSEHTFIETDNSHRDGKIIALRTQANIKVIPTYDKEKQEAGKPRLASFEETSPDGKNQTIWTREGDTKNFAQIAPDGAKKVRENVSLTFDEGLKYDKEVVIPASPIPVPTEKQISKTHIEPPKERDAPTTKPPALPTEKSWNPDVQPTAEEKKIGITRVTEVNIEDASGASKCRLGYMDNRLIEVITPDNIHYSKIRDGDDRIMTTRVKAKTEWYFRQGAAGEYIRVSLDSTNKFFYNGGIVRCGSKDNAWYLDEAAKTLQRGKFTDTGDLILAKADGSLDGLLLLDGTSILATQSMEIKGKPAIKCFVENYADAAGKTDPNRQITWTRDKESNDFTGIDKAGQDIGKLTNVVINVQDGFKWDALVPPTQGEKKGTPTPPASNVEGEKKGTPTPPASNVEGEKKGPPTPPASNVEGEKKGPPTPPASNVEGEKKGPPIPPDPTLSRDSLATDKVPSSLDVGVEISKEQGALLIKEISKLAADAQTLQEVDGKSDLVRSDATGGGKIAIANYDRYKRGYHWDATGKLDMVVVNSVNQSAKVFMRGANGKFYYQPNGAADPTNRMERASDMYVDDKGTLYEMHVGEFDDQHKPKPGSIYNIYGRENDKTFAALYRSNGSHSKVFFKDGVAEPIEYEGTNEGANPVQLKRIENSNRWEGNVKNENGADTKLIAYNLKMASDNTLSYTDQTGYQRIVSSDGFNLNETMRKHGFDQAGRLNHVSWRNGNTVSFSPGFEEGQFVYQRWNGSYMERTVFKQTGKTQKVDINGVGTEIPIWSKTFEVPGRAPINQGQVVFKPLISRDGHIFDMGRIANAPPGSVFDWDFNAFVTKEYYKRREEELHKRVLI